MTKRIFWVIFSTSLLFFLLGASLCSYLLHKRLETTAFESMSHQADFIQELLKKDPRSIELFSLNQDRISIITQNGKIIFDSFSSKPSFQNHLLENHLNRPEIQNSLKNGYAISKRHFDFLGTQALYYAKLIDGNKILRITNYQDNFLGTLLNALPLWIGILLFSLILCSLLAFYLTKYLITPLEKLNLRNLNQSHFYPELQPFITKITQQEKIINRQIKTLKQKQEEFNTITQNMQECFLIIDPNLRVISFNKIAHTLFKKIKINCSIALITKKKSLKEAIKSALNGQRNQITIQINHAHYQVFSNSIYQENKIIGAIIFILDITEKKEHENLRREFSANVSHELKTPLTSISGYAELLKNNLVGHQDISSFGDKIYHQAQRLLILINDIIKLSRLDEGNLFNQKESFSLRCEVQKILEYLPKNNLTIEVRGDSHIYGVKNLILDMIFNLCENAIKYNKPYGSILITLTQDYFHIKDTGYGIAKENQKRVFERFFREDKSHSQTIEGTGLGLSIVKHIASLHHFRIKLKSKINEGTEIFIYWKD